MPTTELTDDNFTDGKITVLELMLAAGLIPSKGEGRRLVQQGGVSVSDKKVTDPNTAYTADDFSEGLVLKKGKKVYHRFLIK